MLLVVVLVTCISILGRIGGQMGLPTRVIGGETEIVQVGIGFAVFCALPWAMLEKGHVRVDLLSPLWGRHFNLVLDCLANVTLTFFAILVAWRLWIGMLSKMASNETTFMLGWPVWYGYAAAQCGVWLFVVAGLVCIRRDISSLFTRPYHAL